MEVPEVPILIGNLIVPIVALLGALLLAWAMLADVLDLCRIVGEVAYDVGTLYEVASSLPGDVLIHYAGPTECIWDGSNINCSFFNITTTGIAVTKTRSSIYTLGWPCCQKEEIVVGFRHIARYFTSFVKVSFVNKYADEYNLPNPQTYYVYRGISVPVPRNNKMIFQQGGNEIQIKKEELDDPLILIYNKAFEVKENYDESSSSSSTVKDSITVTLHPNEFLTVDEEKLCLLKKIDILPGDLSMINETTDKIFIYPGKYSEQAEYCPDKIVCEPEEISLRNFKSVVVSIPSKEVDSRVEYIWEKSIVVLYYVNNRHLRRTPNQIWYYKLDGCVSLSNLNIGISIDNSCNNLGSLNYMNLKVDITYDGSTMTIKCKKVE